MAEPAKSRRKKTGGRQEGAPNKRTKELTALLEEKFPGYNPIVAMATIANDEEVDLELRSKMHKEVSQYIAPKRKAIEHSGNTGIMVHLKDLSGD